MSKNFEGVSDPDFERYCRADSRRGTSYEGLSASFKSAHARARFTLSLDATWHAARVGGEAL